MKTFKIITLGCKVNQFESEAIQNKLELSGFAVALKSNASDFCIINTCTVTGKASMQSRQAIRHAIKNNPDSNIIVTGCYAQTEANEIKKIAGVDHIISHSEKHLIPDLIIKKMKDHVISKDCNTSCLATQFKEINVDVIGQRTRPFLKIQDGCNSFCTYCIVPHSRGRSRSMPFNDVLSRLKSLGQNHYKEVVLTGIHIGNYGRDLTPETDFFHLLNEIEKIKPVQRIRISSIEPAEISDGMIELISQSDIFCDHFHIPLQSGDDSILSKMHRPYNADYFKKLVLKINKKMPHAAIGADILSGFPGESDAAFNNTYNLIKELPVSYLHVFPFSPRKNTPAASMDSQVEIETIKKRCASLRELSIKKKNEFYTNNLGSNLSVLVENKRNKTTGMLKGITSNYINVFLDGENHLKNSMAMVISKKFYKNNALYGEVCGSPSATTKK